MTDVFVDTSVLITWFHSTGERGVESARAVLAAHQEGVVRARVLDLAVYELGNVLARSLRWSADRVVDQVEDLLAIVGPPAVLDRTGRAVAASLAGEHLLTYYDARRAAVARVHQGVLVSGDRQLLDAGLAVTPGRVAAERPVSGYPPTAPAATVARPGPGSGRLRP